MTPEYHRALMDVAEMISKLRNQAATEEDCEQVVVFTYQHVLRKLIAMMDTPQPAPFKYSPVPAIEADLRRRIDDE